MDCFVGMLIGLLKTNY